MRDLSKTFSEKELRWILSQLEDVDLSDYDDAVFDQVEEIVKYVGAHDFVWDELGFFIKLVEMNPNYETEPIKVPKLKSFDVLIGVDVIEYVYEKWYHTIKTYLDVTDTHMIKDQLSEVSYWEGRLYNRDEYNNEITEENIIRVEKRND